MKTIWKFGLGPGKSEIYMPVGAVILSVQTQREEPQVWALVDPSNADNELEVRTLHVVATGELFNDAGLKYLGTFQMAGGSLVFHAFEEAL